MATLIVPVGTSILENGIKAKVSEYEEAKGVIEELENLSRNKINDHQEEVDSIKTFLQHCNNSAELDTIYKVREDLQQQNEAINRIKLIASDTIIGELCAERIESILNDNKFSVGVKHIDGLQVWRKDEFLNSLNGLFDLFVESLKYDKIITVISGGFKALLPYLSIYAQFVDSPIYYKFEDSDELIKIMPLDVKFDYEKIKGIVKDLVRLSNGEDININNDIRKYVEIIENEKFLSAFGELVLEKFIKEYGAIIQVHNQVKVDSNFKEGVVDLIDRLYNIFGTYKKTVRDRQELGNDQEHLCHPLQQVDIPEGWCVYKNRTLNKRIIYKKEGYIIKIIGAGPHDNYVKHFRNIRMDDRLKEIENSNRYLLIKRDNLQIENL